MKTSIFTPLLMAFCLLAACQYTLKVKDGQTAYQLKQYDKAIPMLEKEFQRAQTRTDKGKIAYKIGDAYAHQGKPADAQPWFQEAYNNNYGPDALKAQAYGLKQLERYPEAKEAFKNLGIEIGSPYEYRKELTACQVAEGWKKEPDNGWRLEPTAFNSPQNDFGAVPYHDGRLVFTSDRNMSTGDEAYTWTGKRFMDLFIVDAAAASPQGFDTRINTPANEGTPCFNKNFTEMYFVRSMGAYKGDDRFNRIFFCDREGDSWSEPKPLPFQKDRVNYVHPALSADGKTLFFAADDPEYGGGFDLFSVRINPSAEYGWDAPKPLSRNLNTTGNELFPVVDADTLYFASEGLPGMGGLDVFRTYRVDGNAWAPPINLKPPVNSGADDFAFVITHREKPGSARNPGDLLLSGYMTSNRVGGSGADDIYRVEKRIPPPIPPKIDTPLVKPAEAKLLLDVFVLEKIYAVPGNPNAAVLGRKPLADAAVRATNNNKTQNLRTPVDGPVRIELAKNTDYEFMATHPDFLSNTGRFSTKGIAPDPNNPEQVFELEIVLDRIFKGQEIVLENIYYDYDKWDIRPDAEPTLNALSEVLRQNPGIRIQLGSHTDCRGNDDYNQNLSQKRAESAVNYLIGKGIDAGRLGAIGYGESNPAVTCVCARCTEAEHQSNRRTTFKIVE